MEFYWNKIKTIRVEKKLSSVEIARAVGISRSTLWLWEKGTHLPSEKKIRALAKALGSSVKNISNLEEEKPQTTENFSSHVDSWSSLRDKKGKWQTKSVRMLSQCVDDVAETIFRSSIIIDALMNSMETMFYIKDINLKYIAANATFKSNVSYNLDQELLGSDDYRFFLLLEAKDNESEDDDVLIKGKEINREGFIPGSRKKKWGIISKKPIYDSKENIAGVAGFFTDITNRKIDECRRELLETGINSVSDGVVIFESSGKKIFFINEAYEKLTGYSIDNFLNEGHDFFENFIVHQDYLESYIKNTTTLKSPTKLKIVKKNGEERWVNITRNKIFFKDTEYNVAIFKDITDEREHQLKIELMGEVLNNTKDVFWIFNVSEKSLINVSNSILEVYGYEKDSIICNEGLDFWLHKCIDPESRIEIEKIIDTESKTKTLTYKALDNVGNKKVISSTITIHKEDEILYMAVLERDISEVHSGLSIAIKNL
ncbi:MAG: PAS domain S-box protein [bacterium]|nr:PAS domain S-box protein [bacterium]